MAIFFGLAGGLTAVGPVLGGYPTEWTWRAIFWVNIPVAPIALVLIALVSAVTDHRPAPIDYGDGPHCGRRRLERLRVPAVGFLGVGEPVIWISIIAGLALLVTFYFVEYRTEAR